MKGLAKGSFVYAYLLSILLLIPFLLADNISAATQAEVAEYVRDNILGGDLLGVTLWMTDNAYDQTCIARDADPAVTDFNFPYDATWLVMIDDNPSANWGHPCRWAFIRDDFTEHIDIDKTFPPGAYENNGAGPQIDFGCVDLSGMGADDCPVYTIQPVPLEPGGDDKDCLYAVLMSGGYNNASNYARYPSNLARMYQILRRCGYPKYNIYVFYDNGTSLDLDNLDNDNDNSTGNDVDGAANETNIRARIQHFCTFLDPEVDILFLYGTNHGTDNRGMDLWDFNNNTTTEDNEIYSPSELGDDTEDCSVCRLFMLFDQCFSGEFLALANDGNHDNAAIYVAASDTQCSYDSEYLDAWDDDDPSTTDINDMHPDSLPNSTSGKAEGTAGLGDNSLCECCVKPGGSSTNKDFHQGIDPLIYPGSDVWGFQLTLMGERIVQDHYDGFLEGWRFLTFDSWTDDGNTYLKWWGPYIPPSEPMPLPYCTWVHLGWQLDQSARILEAGWTDIEGVILWPQGVVREVGHDVERNPADELVLRLTYDIPTDEAATVSDIYFLTLQPPLPLDELKPWNPLFDTTTMIPTKLVPLDLTGASPIEIKLYPYVPGDINHDGMVDQSDTTYFNAWLDGGPPPPYYIPVTEPPFYPAADCNGDCIAGAIADLVYLNRYLMGDIDELDFCADYIPISKPLENGDYIIFRFNGAGDNEYIDFCQQEIVFEPDAYEYLPGDVNMVGGTWPPSATGPDVTYLVNFFRGAPTSHSCLLGGFWCSADANGDCNIIGSDVTKLVNVFRGQGSIEYCPDYPSEWPTPADLPDTEPPGWPNCEP